MIKTYLFDDKTQLSAHFNVSEFRCKCGKAHDTLLADELVNKLEQLYSALNCSKIIVTVASAAQCTTAVSAATAQGSIQRATLPISAVTGKMDSLSVQKQFAARRRILASAASQILRLPTSTHTLMCVLVKGGMAMRCRATAA